MEIRLKDLPKDLQGNVVIEIGSMPVVCYGCGKKMGTVEYVGRCAKFDHLNMRPLCKECFDKSGIKEVDWSKVPRPW